MGKNPPASAGDVGSILEQRRSTEEGTATHSSIPAWTEGPGGLQSLGMQKSWTQLSD